MAPTVTLSEPHSVDNLWDWLPCCHWTTALNCHIVNEPWCQLPHHHCTLNPVAQPLYPNSHLHDLSNLASLHGSVNWHSHCTCEVYWSFVNGTYSFGTHMHLYTRQTHQTFTPICRNLYPCWWVWVCPGKGIGSPGIPQGYLWQSLHIVRDFYN